MLRIVAVSLAVLATGLTANAADFSDPTWPCVQRKVENLSAGLMWATPMDPAAVPDDPDLRDRMDEIAGTLALRRVTIDEMRPELEAFAEDIKGSADVLGAIFMETFDSLNTRRSRVVAGIGDFSLGQIALAEKIEAARTEMDAQMARDEPDFDRVDALEEQLDWDQLIFSDRQTTIQYLCETPVIIEKRIFAIAQMLQMLVRDES